MFVGSFVLLLTALSAGQPPAAPPPSPAPAQLSSTDEQTLKTANIGVDGTCSPQFPS